MVLFCLSEWSRGTFIRLVCFVVIVVVCFYINFKWLVMHQQLSLFPALDVHITHSWISCYFQLILSKVLIWKITDKIRKQKAGIFSLTKQIVLNLCWRCIEISHSHSLECVFVGIGAAIPYLPFTHPSLSFSSYQALWTLRSHPGSMGESFRPLSFWGPQPHAFCVNSLSS